MVEIHNNIIEQHAWLFYSENKLKETTIERILNTPDVTPIDLIENSIAWYDVLAQTHREYNNGIKGTYYVQYKYSLFEITKDGSIDNDNHTTEYPFSYFVEVLNYLIDVGDCPTVKLK